MQARGDIKKAYRKSALNGTPIDTLEAIKAATERCRKVQGGRSEAYAILSDPKKRDMYDQGLDLEEIEQGGSGMGGHPFGGAGVGPNDIFRMFFGGGGGGEWAAWAAWVEWEAAWAEAACVSISAKYCQIVQIYYISGGKQKYT